MKRCGALLLTVIALTTGLAVVGPARPASANGVSLTATLAVGSAHVCALGVGRVYCWGEGTAGALGDGTSIAKNVATAVDTTGVLNGRYLTRLTAGLSHACALDNSGLAFCWGVNVDGTLGDGSTTNRLSPVAVTMPGGVAFKSIAATRSHTCAVSTAGAGYCWGDNVSGALGNGTTVNSLTPVAVTMSGVAGGTFSQISVGSFFSCGLNASGKAYCWGDNTNGYLGDGTATDSSTPVAVDTSGALSGKTLTKITTDWAHSCALDSDGIAYCWGENGDGQLGDNTIVNKTSPVAVNVAGVLAGKQLVDIDAGFSHTCALDSDGVAYCWGGNSSGALGNGSSTDSLVPVAVDVTALPPDTKFRSIGAGALSSCAQKANGRTWCWGEGIDGQLGGGGNSGAFQPESTVAVLPVIPEMPINASVVRSGTTATVSWTPPADPGSTDITAYNVYASPGGATCSTATTSCQLTGLTASASYTVRVTAVNEAGQSTSAFVASAGSGSAGGGGSDGLANTGTRTLSYVVVGLLALWLGVRLRRCL